MAKKSKRQRKLEKERELKKSIVTKKQRRAYTKHKKKICGHYSLNIESGYFDTYLTKNKDGTYKCSGCGKIFNNEQVERIESLCEYLTTPGTKTTEEVAKLLTSNIMPNVYYYIAPDKTELCEIIEQDPEILVRNYENNRMKTKDETLEYLELLIKKAGNEILCAKDATKIFGEPQITLFEFPSYIWCSYDYYPYYQPEELIELLKNSENADDAYKKIGRMLSLSNLTHGITKKLTDYRIADLEERHDECEENKKSIFDEDRKRSSTLMPIFENIFFREDLFEYLLQKGFDNKGAHALMNEVGQEEYNPHYKIFYKRFFSRSEKLDREFYEWAEKVRYLPSRKLIFEIFDQQNT